MVVNIVAVREAEGRSMLTRIRQLLDADLSIAELIGIVVMLAAPYLFIGVVWTGTHAHSLHGLRSLELTNPDPLPPGVGATVGNR